MGSAGVANGNISGAGASLVSNFDSYGEPAYPHLDRRSASHTAPSLYPLYGYCSAAYAMHPFNRPAGSIITVDGGIHAGRPAQLARPQPLDRMTVQGGSCCSAAMHPPLPIIPSIMPKCRTFNWRRFAFVSSPLLGEHGSRWQPLTVADFSTYGQTDPSSFDQTPGAGPSSRPFQQSHWDSDIPPLPSFNIVSFDGGNDSPSDQPWLHDTQWQFQGLPAQNATAPTQSVARITVSRIVEAHTSGPCLSIQPTCTEGRWRLSTGNQARLSLQRSQRHNGSHRLTVNPPRLNLRQRRSPAHHGQVADLGRRPLTAMTRHWPRSRRTFRPNLEMSNLLRDPPSCSAGNDRLAVPRGICWVPLRHRRSVKTRHLLTRRCPNPRNPNLLPRSST